MKLIILFFFSVIIKVSFSQELLLNDDTEFNDGVYLSHIDFMSNSPSLKLSDIEISKVTKRVGIMDLDYSSGNSGLKLACSIDDLWGICINGRPYIKIGNNKKNKHYNDNKGVKIIDNDMKVYYFEKMLFIGHLCSYFVTSYTTSTYSASPFPGLTNKRETIMSSSQFLFKVSTGEHLAFNSTNLLTLIADDNDLYMKFKQLSKKKKRNEIFNIFRGYNKRNPIIINE